MLCGRLSWLLVSFLSNPLNICTCCYVMLQIWVFKACKLKFPRVVGIRRLEFAGCGNCIGSRLVGSLVMRWDLARQYKSSAFSPAFVIASCETKLSRRSVWFSIALNYRFWTIFCSCTFVAVVLTMHSTCPTVLHAAVTWVLVQCW